jgi:hypothetical protein
MFACVGAVGLANGGKRGLKVLRDVPGWVHSLVASGRPAQASACWHLSSESSLPPSLAPSLCFYPLF